MRMCTQNVTTPTIILNFREENFRDQKSNHEIHENLELYGKHQALFMWIWICIFRYCRPGELRIIIQNPDDTDVNFDIQCDTTINRVGFLCSTGYSAVLGSRTCRQCSNWHILLFPVFSVIGVLAIIFIKYLNVTITAGFINRAIFYSNIVSLNGSTLVPGCTLINGAIVLVSFPTLNLGFETCLHDKMNALEKVWWQLSFPLYLFVLMAITFLPARTKYLKFNQSSGLSTIQTFATLLILCYVSVLEACIELIGLLQLKVPVMFGG